MPLGPRTRTTSTAAYAHATVGVHVVTPLRLEGGGAVLVNRGWIPNTHRNTKSGELQPTGTVELDVVVRERDNPSSLIPDNVPKKNEWFSVDVGAMSEHCGFKRDLPYVEAVGGSRDSLPLCKEIKEYETFSLMPMGHMGYAATWFTLTGASLVMAAISLRKKKPGLPKPPTGA